VQAPFETEANERLGPGESREQTLVVRSMAFIPWETR
jgi:hypothetical protein